MKFKVGVSALAHTTVTIEAADAEEAFMKAWDALGTVKREDWFIDDQTAEAVKEDIEEVEEAPTKFPRPDSSNIPVATGEFNMALEAFIARQQAIVQKERPNYTLGRMSGPKYVRIYARRDGSEDRDAFGFVEIATGDCLKADGWKRPAKHARGNIYEGSTFGPYGIG